MSSRREKLIHDLEKLGEPEARRRFIQGNYGHDGEIYSVIKTWLDSKDATRRSEAESRTERREEETLSIVREANSISREANSLSQKALFNSRQANIIAIIAMILSAATAIIAAVIQFKP